MSDTPETLWEKFGWWSVGIITVLVGAIHGMARREMSKIESESKERDATMRRDFNDHLIDSNEGFQRLSSVEVVAQTVQIEMREMRAEFRADRKEMMDKLDRILENK